MENLLKYSNSPYLKQHESNPVYWQPWNKETLEKAKKSQKPIFLSVGYASCHWCHVMAHESFEDNETAKIMNEKFINIKVDREERPDLDYVFQRSLSILTGAQGGWPLSMFLDENGVPFTGGTYFPPKEMHGRPNFRSVLENVSDVYEKNREKIISQVDQMKSVFDELNRKTSVLNQPLEPFVERIIQYLDKENGGFKGAPKFPQFYMFDAIFYFYLKTNNKIYLDAVELLLKKISSRGIYDQLGGGISRYTVDKDWIIPHFEKMLYDNIQYVDLLSKFYNSTKKDYYKDKLKQTISFINLEFKNKDNLLGSAYDADSDGIEGLFYTWEYDEIKEILKESYSIFEKKYEITKEGNFESKNILIEKENFQLNKEEFHIIEEIEKKLLLKRNERNKPFFDDKAQIDLNSFWIYSNFQASIVLDNEDLKEKTINTLKLINNKTSDKIYHCNKNDEVDVFLEDYVYYCLALLSYYEIEGNDKYLNILIEKMNETWELFFDQKNKLLQKNKIGDNDLFVNPIDINDNNIPNGNSVFLNLCNKMNLITKENHWLDKTEILKKTFHSLINYNSTQMFSYIKSLDLLEENISFTFHGNKEKFNEIIKILLKKYFSRASFVYEKSAKEDFIIVCRNKVCSDKIYEINSIESFLQYEKSV
ncbi:thioredoxin domain-containing protein [Candidatus Pelagibacter sp.]|nr:thioredoxin domain-containing protein [Candidatus Pelagibacter sp.]